MSTGPARTTRSASATAEASPWATKIYNDAIARGKDHPHAARILARAWLTVTWYCWQDDTAYETAYHRALQAVLNATEAA